MVREKAFLCRLRQLRAEKGVTQMQMSQDLGMTKNYIYNIEKGYAYPSMTQFFAICDYFDIFPYEFMRFEPDTNAKEDELLDAVHGWSDEEIDRLIAFAKRYKE